ncbi:hypothetical protein IGI04_002740 [Brassica rapa subsp. trilocularis]|uniref:Uncharacterized protein n=1 Tax=Brassica rapa subsp. trilocularis TaxID=1813537 RepID=A0ABQ7NWD3_BRACM|nr:hypothetical protein IGI04_002740 [Brassica rapa subsp. trilocularis]
MYLTASVLCYLIIHPYTSSFLSSCFPSVLSSQHDQILNRIPLFLSHSANHPHMTQVNKERRLGLQPAILNRHQYSPRPSSNTSLGPVMIDPSTLGSIPWPYRRLPLETIKQSAEPTESVASGLAGHQAGSARLSHRSPVPSLDILVAIHSCRDQNQSHANKEDSRPPKRLERSSGLISLFGSVCLSLSVPFPPFSPSSIISTQSDLMF